MAIATQSAAAAAWLEGAGNVKSRSYRREVLGRFFRNKQGVGALTVILLLIFAAVAAPIITAYDPIVGNVSRRLLPIGTSGHIFGTDEQGRDMLTRLFYGGRISLVAGIVPVFVATLLGTMIGAVAGYSRGWIGAVLMRSMDMLYAFPAIILAIAVSASLGPGVRNAVIAISIVFIPPIARVAEAATRQVIVLEYIEAARLSGANTPQIILYQVLSNIFSPIFVYASGLVGLSIVIASGLSFLGLGANPPNPEWGFMLNSLRGSIYVQPWVAALPGLFIFITSVAFNVMSDAIRDAIDIKGS